MFVNVENVDWLLCWIDIWFVSENASDINKNAGISIGLNAGLCTDPKPSDLLATKRYLATSQLAQLALTDVT